MSKIYINGTASISAQNSLDFNSFCEDVLEYESDFLKMQNPKYKQYIKPIQARRMSKTVKNGIVCSTISLQEAEVENPDAIIVGTGLGIVSDTEKFLEKMLADNEQYLTPTSFIQSTHNTVAAQLAVRLKCHNYNFTYVNRGFSFETALQDAMMHINEGKKNILVGGADEMTENYFKKDKKTGWWKTSPVKNTEIFKSNSDGSLYGESVSFFVVSSEKKENSYAEIKDLDMFLNPKNNDIIKTKVGDFLKKNNIENSDIDLVIFGKSGDKNTDAIYDNVKNTFFENTQILNYKHLVGENQTANSFSLWLASKILKSQKIPNSVKENNIEPKNIRNILIYNHFQNINHSLMLISNI